MVVTDIPMNVCNDQLYGFIPVPVDMNHTSMKTTEADQLLNVKMEALSQGIELPLGIDSKHTERANFFDFRISVETKI